MNADNRATGPSAASTSLSDKAKGYTSPYANSPFSKFVGRSTAHGDETTDNSRNATATRISATGSSSLPSSSGNSNSPDAAVAAATNSDQTSGRMHSDGSEARLVPNSSSGRPDVFVMPGNEASMSSAPRARSEGVSHVRRSFTDRMHGSEQRYSSVMDRINALLTSTGTDLSEVDVGSTHTTMTKKATSTSAPANTTRTHSFLGMPPRDLVTGGSSMSGSYKLFDDNQIQASIQRCARVSHNVDGDRTQLSALSDTVECPPSNVAAVTTANANDGGSTITNPRQSHNGGDLLREPRMEGPPRSISPALPQLQKVSKPRGVDGIPHGGNSMANPSLQSAAPKDATEQLTNSLRSRNDSQPMPPEHRMTFGSLFDRPAPTKKRNSAPAAMGDGASIVGEQAGYTGDDRGQQQGRERVLPPLPPRAVGQPSDMSGTDGTTDSTKGRPTSGVLWADQSQNGILAAASQRQQQRQAQPVALSPLPVRAGSADAATPAKSSAMSGGAAQLPPFEWKSNSVPQTPTYLTQGVGAMISEGCGHVAAGQDVDEGTTEPMERSVERPYSRSELETPLSRQRKLLASEGNVLGDHSFTKGTYTALPLGPSLGFKRLQPVQRVSVAESLYKYYRETSEYASGSGPQDEEEDDDDLCLPTNHTPDKNVKWDATVDDDAYGGSPDDRTGWSSRGGSRSGHRPMSQCTFAGCSDCLACSRPSTVCSCGTSSLPSTPAKFGSFGTSGIPLPGPQHQRAVEASAKQQQLQQPSIHSGSTGGGEARNATGQSTTSGGGTVADLLRQQQQFSSLIQTSSNKFLETGDVEQKKEQDGPVKDHDENPTGGSSPLALSAANVSKAASSAAINPNGKPGKTSLQAADIMSVDGVSTTHTASTSLGDDAQQREAQREARRIARELRRAKRAGQEGIASPVKQQATVAEEREAGSPKPVDEAARARQGPVEAAVASPVLVLQDPVDSTINKRRSVERSSPESGQQGEEAQYVDKAATIGVEVDGRGRKDNDEKPSCSVEAVTDDRELQNETQLMETIRAQRLETRRQDEEEAALLEREREEQRLLWAAVRDQVWEEESMRKYLVEDEHEERVRRGFNMPLSVPEATINVIECLGDERRERPAVVVEESAAFLELEQSLLLSEEAVMRSVLESENPLNDEFYALVERQMHLDYMLVRCQAAEAEDRRYLQQEMLYEDLPVLRVEFQATIRETLEREKWVLVVGEADIRGEVENDEACSRVQLLRMGEDDPVRTITGAVHRYTNYVERFRAEKTVEFAHKRELYCNREARMREQIVEEWRQTVIVELVGCDEVRHRREAQRQFEMRKRNEVEAAIRNAQMLQQQPMTDDLPSVVGGVPLRASFDGNVPVDIRRGTADDGNTTYKMIETRRPPSQQRNSRSNSSGRKERGLRGGGRR